MRQLLVGTTLMASFLGGMVALFAPCCISVMLPAYFASSFRRRRQLLSMTLVFALGVGTVILPIALGASGVSRLIQSHHTGVFLAGAFLMFALGVAMLTGWKPALPMIGMRGRSDRGPGAVFSLGAFSGVASACCAPVLAGVVALSGAASSFFVALAVGVAYVVGMVLPLLLMALLWDRYDWGESRLLTGRTFSFTLLGRQRRLHSTAALSGLLLIGMAALAALLAVTGPSMPTRGWQVTLTARLQHYGSRVSSWLSPIPGWVFALVLAAGIGVVVWKAIGQTAGAHQPDGRSDDIDDDDPKDSPSTRHVDATPAERSVT